jgi:hypothetical protein
MSDAPLTVDLEEPTLVRSPDGNDPVNRWRTAEDGTLVMPPMQRAYLDWLLTYPRCTQAEWCRENNVDERSVRRWKSEKKFKREWEVRAAEQNISTDKVQAVVDQLHLTATTNTGPAGVKAAALYLEYVGRFMPTRKVVTQEDDLGKFTDAELVALVAQGNADAADV